MKITDIKTFVVNAYRTNFVFVKMYTDEGVTGVGEGTLEYKEQALVGAINDLKPYLIGQDPRQIEKHVYMMYRDSYWRTGAVLMSAISAVEIAMWDISGKVFGVPVSHLLGGPVRDSVRMYANAWFAGAKTPAEFAAKAKDAVAKGVSALKWDPFGKAYLTMTNREFGAMLECVAAVREAAGDATDLLIEGHGRLNVSTAIQVSKAIERFHPMFLEEPVPPDNLDALAEVRAKSAVPIAAGERVYSQFAMREFLEKKCADFVQPDVSHAGGILALKKMAAMAENNYLCFAPHNPSGPVANAASLQLAANLNNFFILEIMLTDVAWRPELTNEEVVFDKGSIRIPQKPGLGIDINEAACLRHPYQPVQLRHYNGSLTDIRPAGAETIYYFKGI
ncbi:MAG: galactonate dehydratase [Dehalococcoidia bacterium]|jgi:galactonate dehydratase|nr:galactonate dehydratase [Dehalococcoidia bacterium]